MPITSKWDGSCKICGETWKAGTQVNGIKTLATDEQGRVKLRWCINAACKSDNEPAAAENKTVETNAMDKIPALNTTDQIKIKQHVDYILGVNNLVKEQMSKYIRDPAPAMIGMITKEVLSQLANTEVPE